MLKFLILACAVSAIHACGVPAFSPVLPDASLNIVGGHDAQQHSWPWMTEVILNGGHYCGATLISDEWILSAAHCFDYADSRYQFSVGGHHSGDLGESTRQTFSAQQIIKHPDYNGAQSFDVALIQISGVSQNNYVSPVCVPSSRVSDGYDAVVTGWGDQETIIYDEDLKQVVVPIVNDDVCSKAYRLYGGIDDSEICAGYEQGGKDSCQGDSGGPMVANIDGKWNVVGVVSWGVGCADAGKYGVYADVSYQGSSQFQVDGIRDWIESITGV